MCLGCLTFHRSPTLYSGIPLLFTVYKKQSFKLYFLNQQGMTELNNCDPRPIKVLGKFLLYWMCLSFMFYVMFKNSLILIRLNTLEDHTGDSYTLIK